MTIRLKYGLIGVGFFVFLQFVEHIAKYGWPS